MNVVQASRTTVVVQAFKPARHGSPRGLDYALVFVAACLTLTLAAQTAADAGVRDPAWSPDGKRLAISYFDRIWITGADGRGGRALRPESTAIERDPAWSPDGRRLAFAADAGEGFDIHASDADGKNPQRLTSLPVTSDGRHGPATAASFSAAASPAFQLAAAGRQRRRGEPVALFSDASNDSECDSDVSPDGKRVAYVSDRDSEDGDVDLWVAELGADARGRTGAPG